MNSTLFRMNLFSGKWKTPEHMHSDKRVCK